MSNTLQNYRKRVYRIFQRGDSALHNYLFSNVTTASLPCYCGSTNQPIKEG
jgi:hypothetical protein